MGLNQREMHWIACDGKGCFSSTADDISFADEYPECEFEAIDVAEAAGWECDKDKRKWNGIWYCPSCAKKAAKRRNEVKEKLATGKLPLPGQISLLDGSVVPEDAYANRFP